jgi:hypothetical protein
MKIVTLKQLREDHPAHFHDAMKTGRVTGTHVVLPDDFPVMPKPRSSGRKSAQNRLSPLSESAWPIWAKTVSLFRSTKDHGIGDTAERIFGSFGGEIFRRSLQKLTGKTCRCCDRKTTWNQKFPYPKSGVV